MVPGRDLQRVEALLADAGARRGTAVGDGGQAGSRIQEDHGLPAGYACGAGGLQLPDLALSARPAFALSGRLQHSRDRRAAPHHGGLREETGFSLPATGAGTLRQGTTMSTGLETREGLFAVMEQIASEREAAREIVQQLLSSNAPLDDIDIPEGWRTAGMVMELAELAFSGLEADPQQSLSLSLL